MTLPGHARIVVVGGGIAGCSTAYHLARLGQTDVLLLEQGRLTCGTTWHAAGLVGQMRPNRNMTAMSRYGIELYATLEAETGLATGWANCGSVNVAQTPARLKTLRRALSLARGFGVACEEISLAEARDRVPVLETSDLAGAIWIPGDGKANPADLTMSLAKGARLRGVRIVELAEAVGVTTVAGGRGSGARRRVAGVRVRVGEGEAAEDVEIACEAVVNCAGQWARQFGELAGVMVPLWSAEHFYIVTERIDGVPSSMPVVRDPDGCIYYKEEVGGLLMGGFEPKAKPWAVDPIPPTFRFELLGEDWEQFEPLMTAALRRTPCLETARVKMLLNGPESFTPDGNFILGEAPLVDGFFVVAGFNSAGIANSGGAGRLVAEWISGGEPSMDLSDVDIRRFGSCWANKRALAERVGETLGLHYAMRWPRQELASARPLRTSPLHDLLAARGAVFGSKNGWERANAFSRHGSDVARWNETLDRPLWFDDCVFEQRATREAVAVYDQTSFGKMEVEGDDAVALLQRVCAADLDVDPGRIVYTPMLNARGGYESDVTVTRLSEARFLVVTGSAQVTRDLDWIDRQARRGERVRLRDATGETAVLSLMGPNAQALLGRAGSPSTFEALGAQRLRFAHGTDIDVGHARVRAVRMSYVGGPGYELYVPIESARAVWQALHAASEGLGLDGGGLVDAGYYALDALRIEAGRRAWGAELGPDVTPVESGGLQAVAACKAGGFVGAAALREAATAAPRRSIVAVRAPGAWLWGGEVLRRGDRVVGEITSAGWSHRKGCCVALARLDAADGATSRPLEVEAYSGLVAIETGG